MCFVRAWDHSELGVSELGGELGGAWGQELGVRLLDEMNQLLTG